MRFLRVSLTCVLAAVFCLTARAQVSTGNQEVKPVEAARNTESPAKTEGKSATVKEPVFTTKEKFCRRLYYSFLHPEYYLYHTQMNAVPWAVQWVMLKYMTVVGCEW